MKAIRVGVIGVGSLGQHHARVFAELAGARLVGVADVDRARATAIANRHGCRAATDYRELLTDVDAVSVVTPTLLHHRIARTCLAAGPAMPRATVTDTGWSWSRRACARK